MSVSRRVGPTVAVLAALTAVTLAGCGGPAGTRTNSVAAGASSQSSSASSSTPPASPPASSTGSSAVPDPTSGSGTPTASSVAGSQSASVSASDSAASTPSDPSGTASAEASSEAPIHETNPTATLPMGQPATIVDGADAYELTVLALELAPDSVFASSGLSKADGQVYFLYFSVTALRTNPTYFGTDSINGLFLKPLVDPSRTMTRKYVNVPGCVSTPTQLQPGDSGGNCFVYQIPGPLVTAATYDDISKHHLIWR